MCMLQAWAEYAWDVECATAAAAAAATTYLIRQEPVLRLWVADLHESEIQVLHFVQQLTVAVACGHCRSGGSRAAGQME